jgi:hypothetical protein
MITKQEYTEAIVKLMSLAQSDTGGSRVAAQAILSAYNGEDYQLNIVDLCNLDHGHYQAALAVIRGRVELQKEPQNFVENGDAIFRDLWQQWRRLHVTNRGLPDCYTCRGSGSVYIELDKDEHYTRKSCPKCGGKGFGSK